MMKSSKRFLGRVGGRLAAGLSHRRVTAGTARRRVMLSVKKSRQKNFGAEFVIAFGGAEILQGAKPVRLPGGGLLLYARVVAGCAPCRVTQPTLGVTLQRSAAPPFPSGPCVPLGAPYQNTLGAVPQDPLTLKLRLDTNDVNIVRTAPQIRSQGACGAFYWGNCKPIAGSHAVETMGWISSYLSRRPLPRSGGGERGGGRYARGYLWSASVRSTDLDFSSQKNLNP